MIPLRHAASFEFAIMCILFIAPIFFGRYVLLVVSFGAVLAAGDLSPRFSSLQFGPVAGRRAAETAALQPWTEVRIRIWLDGDRHQFFFNTSMSKSSPSTKVIFNVVFK